MEWNASETATCLLDEPPGNPPEPPLEPPESSPNKPSADSSELAGLDMTGEPEPVERVGRFAFTVRAAEDESPLDPRFKNRADALAAWLFARWRYERESGRFDG